MTLRFESVVVCLFLAIGTGCSGMATQRVQIARSVAFDLLPPASLGAAVSLEQIVEAHHGESSSSFHCLLEVDAHELVLVALTPFGTRAFVLTLRGEELGVELEVEAGAMQTLPAPPERILADLQLALWPKLPALAGLTVVESGDAQGRHVREFQRQGVTVIRVTADNDVRWRGNLHFEHLEQGYALAVRTVRAEELAP